MRKFWETGEKGESGKGRVKVKRRKGKGERGE